LNAIFFYSGCVQSINSRNISYKNALLSVFLTKTKNKNKTKMHSIFIVTFLWLLYGVQRHFQQYSSYIVAVNIIGGGNRSTRGKPMTCRMSLTNFIT